MPAAHGQDCTSPADCVHELDLDLKCAVDNKCRIPCLTRSECNSDQVCNTHVCADPDQLDADGNLPMNNPNGYMGEGVASGGAPDAAVTPDASMPVGDATTSVPDADADASTSVPDADGATENPLWRRRQPTPRVPPVRSACGLRTKRKRERWGVRGLRLEADERCEIIATS